MARRSNSNKQTEAQAPVEEQVTEAPAEAQTEAPAEDTKSEDKPIDLTGFKDATSKAVEQRDSSTGEVPADAIGEVNAVYRGLDGIKPKNAAKNWIEDEMKGAITALDIQLARAYSMVKDNLTAAGGAKSERQPADPKLAFVNKLAAHRLALTLITAPEGVDGDEASAQADDLVAGLSEQVEAYRAWAESDAEDKGDAPDTSPVVRTAFKLAAGKASGGGRVSGGSGVRRDIGKHIQAAFSNLDNGAVLTVAEIANTKSEEYGDDVPSQGAVSARLFPQSGKCTVEGIEPVPAADGKPRGARKVA
jgi:hypothetical protein